MLPSLETSAVSTVQLSLKAGSASALCPVSLDGVFAVHPFAAQVAHVRVIADEAHELVQVPVSHGLRPVLVGFLEIGSAVWGCQGEKSRTDKEQCCCKQFAHR